MTSAKLNILNRLKRKTSHSLKTASVESAPARVKPKAEELLDQLVGQLQANHAEVRLVNSDNWQDKFIELLQSENAKCCLLGQGLSYQDELAHYIATQNREVETLRYDASYEALRETLFHKVDISLTQAQCAIADTGTLVLIPDEHEPRTMSLIPPIHVVLLEEEQIRHTFEDVLKQPPWAKNQSMPSNIVFISSPSKTADIQQTLAYGAHGPKKLIVLLRTQEA